MQDYIKKNKLSTRVIYTGFEAQMDKFYSAIDILVLPSLQPDPLPTVVLEAMQYGIPVISTPQGGALEMITENETGGVGRRGGPGHGGLRFMQPAWWHGPRGVPSRVSCHWPRGSRPSIARKIACPPHSRSVCGLLSHLYVARHNVCYP